ncbi:hypothetical protein [Bifidobacterium cuniculi]|uniref:PhnA protein n=1 Tax=Bifidobacterium cuniculi TaxID=1688 RepID=A0A087B4F7_9BIFI|nr:hypothetical protein [Bifidobacterium cuniculi]KFI65907.1 hypothetical protein BCUN_0406 [Bifidobacterium cuniculi]
MAIDETDWKTTRLLDHIQHVRTNLRLLDDIATKRIHLTNNTGTTRRLDSAPTPINLAAADLLDQIHTMSRLLAKAAGLATTKTIPTDPILQKLTQNQYLTTLANRKDYANILTMLGEAAHQSDRMIDPDPTTRIIGRCPNCRAVLSIPREHKPSPGLWGQCRMCGHDYNYGQVQQTQLARLAAANIVDTDTEIRRLLKTAGIEMSGSFLRVSKHRGQLSDLGKDEQGHNLYALAEVYLLVRPDLEDDDDGFDMSNCNG